MPILHRRSYFVLALASSCVFGVLLAGCGDGDEKRLAGNGTQLAVDADSQREVIQKLVALGAAVEGVDDEQRNRQIEIDEDKGDKSPSKGFHPAALPAG